MTKTIKKVKVEVITLTYQDRNLIVVPRPQGIWFNTAYHIRGKLHDSSKVTIVQWLTLSNTNIVETLKMMNKKDIEKLLSLVGYSDSKRAESVKFVINNYLSKLQ